MRVSFIHALTRAWSLPTWRLSKLVVIWILTGQPRLTGFGLWVLFSRVNDRRSFLVPGLGTRPDHFTSKLSDPALARSTRRNQRIFLSGAWQWSWAQRLSPDYPISNEPIICRNLFALMVLICLIFPHLAFLSFGSSAIDLLSKEGSREKLPRGAIYILMLLAWWERYDPGGMGIHAQDDDGRTHCCKES